MGPSIYKIDAAGDTVYVKAWTEDEAYSILCRRMGEIPRSMLTFSTVASFEMPDDAEVLW